MLPGIVGKQGCPGSCRACCFPVYALHCEGPLRSKSGPIQCFAASELQQLPMHLLALLLPADRACGAPAAICAQLLTHCYLWVPAGPDGSCPGRVWRPAHAGWQRCRKGASHASACSARLAAAATTVRSREWWLDCVVRHWLLVLAPCSLAEHLSAMRCCHCQLEG